MVRELEWNEKESTCKLVLLVLASFIFPPIVAIVRRGCGLELLLSLFLYFGVTIGLILLAHYGLQNDYFFWLSPWPGVIYGLYLTFNPLRKEAPPQVYGGTPMVVVRQ